MMNLIRVSTGPMSVSEESSTTARIETPPDSVGTLALRSS
jgi:hypothetical protein